MTSENEVYMPSDRLLNGMQFLAPLRGELPELYTAVIYGGRRLAVRAPEWEEEPIARLTCELPEGLEVRVYATEPNISRLIYHTRQDRLTAWARIVETYLKQTPPHQN